MSKRVVTYSRVSTEDQAKHGYSLPSQIEACRKYAEERGWTVVAEISDDGISGATLDRPGLDRIRDMAQARGIEAIIVYDLDRLSRKAVYQMLLEEELGKADVSIHYVMGDYDDTPEGQFQKQIKAALYEYDRAKIRENMNRGKRSKARQGYVVGGGNIAYGYRYDGNGHLVIEEREAQVVRMIFELYTNGEDLSISEVARRLTASPHKTYTGNKKWRPCTVGCILNKHRKKSEYTNARELRPKDEWIPIPVPLIVNRATFEAAQRRLAHNRKFKRRKPRHRYLLSGMLSCAECGYAYVSTCSKYHRYYYDSGKYTDKKHPTSSSLLRADLVEEKVWEAVKEILLNPSALWEGYKAREAEVLDQKLKLTERLDTMLKLRDKAQHKLDALTEAYLDPDIGISKAEYSRRRQAIEKEIAEWEQEAQVVQERLKAEAITQEQKEALEEFAAKISEGIDFLDFEDKRKVLQILEVRGKVRREDGREWIELEGLFPPTEICVSYKAF
jgi:site-specific DNA recombinase